MNCNHRTYSSKSLGLLAVTFTLLLCPSPVRSLISVFVCLSVRLHISKTTHPNFNKFSEHAICDRGSPVLLWRHYDMLCTSGFVDEFMFSYNAWNIPESKTTRKFRPVAAAPGRSLPSPTTSYYLSNFYFFISTFYFYLGNFSIINYNYIP